MPNRLKLPSSWRLSRSIFRSSRVDWDRIDSSDGLAQVRDSVGWIPDGSAREAIPRHQVSRYAELGGQVLTSYLSSGTESIIGRERDEKGNAIAIDVGCLVV